MAKSQNGWEANNRSLVKQWTIPGTVRKITLEKGDAGYLLTHFAAWFDKNIEDIEAGQLDDWGYAERAIIDSTTLSNHASGTAIDINALKHPLSAVNTFNPEQRAAIRNKLKEYEGCIRWGGDYTGRKDDMHFEINASPAKVTAVANKLRTPKPSPPPNPLPSNVLKLGSSGPEVTRLQSFLNRVYPAYSKLVVDGDFGPATEAVVKEFQRRTRIAADGIVGPITRTKLRF